MIHNTTVSRRFLLSIWSFLISTGGCLIVFAVRGGKPLNTMSDPGLQFMEMLAAASCTVSLWEEFWIFREIGKQLISAFTQPSQGPTPSKLANSGVYLISARTGHYKIGRSTNVANRIRDLSVGFPFELTLVHVIECPEHDHARAEAYLHDLFAHRRVKGEWFSLTPTDVSVIKGIGTL